MTLDRVQSDPVYDTFVDHRASTEFDRFAEVYDALYTHPFAIAEDKIVYDLLHQEIAPGDNVIDLGCGTGLGLRLLNKPPHLYTGVDTSLGMLKKAIERHPQHVFYQADMSAIGNIERPYDAAISLYGSVSYTSGRSALDEMKRILKPGGRFFLMFYGDGARTRAGYTALETANLWIPSSYELLDTWFSPRFDNVRIVPLSGYVSHRTIEENWVPAAIINMLKIESKAMMEEGKQNDACWQIVIGTTRGG